MEELDGFTKELFQVGLKEWRISYHNRSNPSSIITFRIVALNSRDALFLLLKALGYSSLYTIEKMYPNGGIENLKAESKTYISYVIGEKWDGVLAPKDYHPGIYKIDPYDGGLELIGDETLLDE